ncbi:MAG: hypothetical protein DLM68_02590 [Hyphomicrobiales bacterium]|nr:MAG: hypothetical protein DLM68_02590 [Hyphomicrobiales bacterium]
MAGLKARYRPLVCPLTQVLAEIPLGATLYDIGCGAGVPMHLALRFRQARMVRGSDISSNAIAAATSFARHGERFQAMCLPAEEQPALSGFDVVVLIDVLHHVPPAVQQDFLRSIVRRMDRGARLVLLDIDRDAFARRCCNQHHDLLLSREWVHPMRADDVRVILDHAGLQSEEPQRFKTLWYGHYLIAGTRL